MTIDLKKRNTDQKTSESLNFKRFYDPAEHFDPLTLSDADLISPQTHYFPFSGLTLAAPSDIMEEDEAGNE